MSSVYDLVMMGAPIYSPCGHGMVVTLAARFERTPLDEVSVGAN